MLKRVSIPASVEEVKSACFEFSCLEKVKICGGTKISPNAFNGCNRLTCLTIDTNMKKMDLIPGTFKNIKEVSIFGSETAALTTEMFSSDGSLHISKEYFNNNREQVNGLQLSGIKVNVLENKIKFNETDVANRILDRVKTLKKQNKDYSSSFFSLN
jgi:hypothetical protein